MGFITNEIEQDWHQTIINSNEGYLDLDELESRMRGSTVRHKIAQEYITQCSSLRNHSDHINENIIHYEAVVDKEERYRQFLEKEYLNFPAMPVLPPTAPLIKISGIIEEVTFTKAMACFEAEAYSTVQEELARKRERDNAGAALAMIVQSLADDPSRAIINDGKPKKLKCLHVKGKINGKAFSGWFGMTNIRVGDYVEMAAMPDGDAYLVYAITNPEQRTISITPRCYHGTGLPSFSMFFVIFSCISSPFLLIGIGEELSVTFYILFWCLLFDILAAYVV